MNITYSLIQSFINSLPFMVIAIMSYGIFRGPVIKFINKNLVDSGKDKYNSSAKASESKEDNIGDKNSLSEDKVISLIHKTLIDESGKEYFDEYKKNISNLISLRQSELTSYALANVYSESNIEKEIEESLASTIENKTKFLIRQSAEFKELENKTLDKLNIIKVSSFLEHLEKEYDATRSTKALMSNMFILINSFYFFGLMAFLIFGKTVAVSPEIYIALSFSYVGLGAFVVYMIKFCNARSLTLLSLREDFLKRDIISNMANKMVELGTSEHHVALIQLMNSSVATKEQKISHPYEMLLYGIKDSNIMFKGGKFEVKKESSEKPSPK